MATIAEPRVRPVEGERRFVIYNIGWEGYQTLWELLDRHHIRLTYDRGNVELMSPLWVHERYKERLGRAVETVGEEFGVPMILGGSTTFKRQDVDRGLEPDKCYYLTNRDRVGPLRHLDLTVDPPPDLAIEVEITTSALNRLGIYAKLGIPEVWRYDGEALIVLLLQPDGTYASSPTSAAFPFLPLAEVARFVSAGDFDDDLRWAREFRAWVRDDLAPRVRDAAGGAGPP
jgi:Uma2 family endonuclease